MISSRLRAIQISISHEQLNNGNNGDHSPSSTSSSSSPSVAENAAIIMPIVHQRRPSVGRESFRQKNIGCVPQNSAASNNKEQTPNLNIDNCFVLKSQLRR
jgi:hypothetical protein